MIRSVLFLLVSSLLVSLAAAGTTADGLAFLAKKEKEDGVVKLPSGLLYVADVLNLLHLKNCRIEDFFYLCGSFLSSYS